MPRFLILLAGLFAAAAMTLIVREAKSPVQAAASGEVAVPAVLPDPQIALREIERLRHEKGSVLSGSTLAETADDHSFHAAIAGYTGAAPESTNIPPPSKKNDSKNTSATNAIDELRNHAEQLEIAAARYERAGRYAEVDALRAVIANMWSVAREIERGSAAASEEKHHHQQD